MYDFLTEKLQSQLKNARDINQARRKNYLDGNFIDLFLHIIFAKFCFYVTPFFFLFLFLRSHR
jgi:hypothetical protein